MTSTLAANNNTSSSPSSPSSSKITVLDEEFETKAYGALLIQKAGILLKL